MYSVEGGTVCGYDDVEDWKLVLRSDAELVMLRGKVRVLEESETNLTLQVESLQEQVNLSQQQSAILSSENIRLTKELIALDKKYQEERVKPAWGSTLSWSIAGISTAALLGAIITLLAV